MRNLVMVMGALLGLCQGGFCEGLGDQVTGAFVGNAKVAMEYTSKGRVQYEFLDNVIEIGRVKEGRIVGIDLAVIGEQLPNDTVKAVEWGSGVKLHLSPLIKQYVSFNPEWEFVNNLEIDGRYSYNFTMRHATLGISVAYPWK